MNQHLLDKAKAHFNEPFLVGFKLCRLIGYAETDEDCYYIVKHPHQQENKWISCVGGYTFLDSLKNCGVTQAKYVDEVWTDFSRLDSLLELNGAPKEPTFILNDCIETDNPFTMMFDSI